MRSTRFLGLTLFLVAGILWLGLEPALAPGQPAAQQSSSDQAVANAPGVIRAEANLVLVDVVVTDKKGNYIRDLESKDFHAFEDGKEQPIASFSPPSALTGPATASPSKKFLVFFFDDSTMDPGDQMRARQAAIQFLEKSASRDRLMAVVDFTGTLRLVQNFTADVDRLKQAVERVKFAALNPNATDQTPEIAAVGVPSLASVTSDFAARTMLLAIRELCKNLRAVPGRKTLVLLSAGFPLTPERQSELSATIDAANKANVAIYPLDVRGLMAPGPASAPGLTTPGTQLPQPGFPQGGGAALDDWEFQHMGALLASSSPELMVLGPPQPLSQRPPGGGGGAGGAGGGVGGTGTRGGGGLGGGGGTSGTGTSGGSRSGGGSTGGGGRASGGTTGGGTKGTGASSGGARGGGINPNYGSNQRYQTYPPRAIIPPFMESATTNQQVLYALAAGTGGFAIFNTNDFVGGLDKIMRELDEYYILGYVPPTRPHEGSYHSIQVKVGREGVTVRHRNGYYDLRRQDLLAEKPEGKALEQRVAGPAPGNVPVSLKTTYFYSSPHMARVDLALSVPAEALSFEKDKKEFHAEVNILGVAYREDGSVAARFSDTDKRDLDKKQLKEFSKGSYIYRNSFDVASGKYNLKVALSTGGQDFGKYETPLVIEPYSGDQLHLSAVALSDEMQPVSEVESALDAALLEDHKPLVVKGTEFVPSSTNRFNRNEKVGLYVEVYEPLMLRGDPPRVGIIYNVIDRKTNKQVSTSNTILVNSFAQSNNPVIPVAVPLSLEQLQAGDYQLEVIARDAEGHVSPSRTTDFALD